MYVLPYWSSILTPARLRVLGYFYPHFLLSRLLICLTTVIGCSKWHTMRCRLDWLKSTSFHYYVTPVRQRTGSRWQRPWGAFSAPERYGLNRCFWSTVWSFWECNVRASFLFSCRIPCQLCSGGNFTGAFRPQYRSVLATSRLAVSTANDVGMCSFNCTDNNNRLKTGWRLVLVSSCLF